MHAGEVQDYVSEDDMAEVEFKRTVDDWTRKENLRYVWRHARTGRPAKLEDAGRPWTVKGELRQKPVSTLVCGQRKMAKCEY